MAAGLPLQLGALLRRGPTADSQRELAPGELWGLGGQAPHAGAAGTAGAGLAAALAKRPLGDAHSEEHCVHSYRWPAAVPNWVQIR